MRVRLILLSVAVLVLVLGLSGTALGAWPDVGPRTPYYDAIIDLEERDIVSGFPDGTFGPSFNIKRMQFAKMIAKALDLEVSEQDTCPFKDVPNNLDRSDSLYPDNYVAVCAERGITVGKTATTFAPYDPITREQLITMVARAAGLSDPPSTYTPPFASGRFNVADHYQNARKAAYHGLLDGLADVESPQSTYGFRASATRGEVCQLLHNLLNTAGVSWQVTQITNDAYAETSLGISDGILFYDAWGGSSNDLFARDLASDATRQITNDPGGNGIRDMAVRRVLWSGTGLFLYSWSNDHVTQILPSGAFSLGEQVSDQYVVWEVANGIAWHEIATGDQHRVDTTPYQASGHCNIDIAGNLVVFTERDDYDFEVYLVNLADKSVQLLTNDFRDQSHPAICGDSVFWVSPGVGGAELWMYDILTEEARVLDVDNKKGISSLQSENGRVAWWSAEGVKIMNVADGSVAVLENGTTNYQLGDSAIVWSESASSLHVHDFLSETTYRINLPGYRVNTAGVSAKDEVAFIGFCESTGHWDVFLAEMLE